MRTLGDIKDEILVELGVSTSVAYYTDAILNNWINKAHKWAAGIHKWPQTEGRVSTTYASLTTNEDSDLAGEYPEGWKNDSIRLMKIGGDSLEKVNYIEFQEYREDYPDRTDKYFTDFGRRYYINPNADVSGSVVLWGQYTPANLDTTDPDSETVFAHTETGNEAIVEKVLSYANLREKKIESAQYHHESAMQILAELWNQIRAEQYGYKAKNRRMFKHFDVVDYPNNLTNKDRLY